MEYFYIARIKKLYKCLYNISSISLLEVRYFLKISLISVNAKY